MPCLLPSYPSPHLVARLPDFRDASPWLACVYILDARPRSLQGQEEADDERARTVHIAMALEAHHLHHLLPTGHQPAHAHAQANRAGAAAMSDAPFLPGQACYGRDVAGGTLGSLGQQGYQSSYMGLVTPPASAGLGQYSRFCAPAAADASESGVTFGGCPAQEVAPRKRRRADQPPVLGGAADVAAHAHQQLMDVDRLVLHHAAKMWAELAEQRRRHARQMVGAVEAAAAKRLRAKDEEIDRIGRLNWALEERLRSLYVEAQVWRDLAQSNEAAANVLRGELEQARCGGGGAGAGGDDAESGCCGENDVANGAGVGEDEVRTVVERQGTGRGRCKGCGEGAAVVLLLPCRHLCACEPCAAAARACPACGCAKNGSVCVNFS